METEATVAMLLDGMSQEEIDDAIRAVADVNLFIVGEVYGSHVTAGPPLYPYHHNRVYGVLIEDVDDELVKYRYVMNRAITQGALRGTRPDVVIDSVMEADGPCFSDWTVKDEGRTSRVVRRGPDESFVDHGDDEYVTFVA